MLTPRNHRHYLRSNLKYAWYYLNRRNGRLFTLYFGEAVRDVWNLLRPYQEEYLDGVAMQYVVEQHGRPLAYFKDQEDAELFANAKAAASRTDAVPDYNV